ncbi:unnamed protein product, partial [Dibothriocephalus latus]
MEESRLSPLTDQGLGGLAPTDSVRPKQNVNASHADNMWLDACKAVVLCELTTFEKYLRSVDDLDRRLTKRPGYKLLDIARAYRRANFVDILMRERECVELDCSVDPDPISIQSCFPFNSSIAAAAAATAGSFESPPPSPRVVDFPAH